jgi:predicted MFS family arabinose efflux permease
MAAAVAEMVPPSRTASAYGIFTMAFGIAWFLGSALLGLLYDRSLPLMVLVAVLLQLAAVPFLVAVARRPAATAGEIRR